MALRDCGPKSSSMWPELLARVSGDVFIDKYAYLMTGNDTDDAGLREKRVLAFVSRQGFQR